MNNNTTFKLSSGEIYEISENGRFYCTPLNGKKTRVGKLAYEEAYRQYMAKKAAHIEEDEGSGETVDYKGYKITGTETAGFVAVDPHGSFAPTSFKTIDEAKAAIDEDVKNSKPLESAVIDESGAVDCRKCKVENCVHRDCMRRNPVEIGGLGECPRLKVSKPEPKKASKKPRAKKVQVGGMEFDHNGIKVILTPKQVDFIKHLPDTDFWDNGVNSKIWIDILCDDIGGQFAGKPMTVGAMISTLCEKGLGVRGTERRDGRKCVGFALSELGQKIATELGL